MNKQEIYKLRDMLFALDTQIAHERQMLREWKKGDTSLLPPNWDTTKQLYFVRGMEHARSILKEHKKYI